MSAYDNPAIIKDNSGMIWAQGLAQAGENFVKARAAVRDRQIEEQQYEEKLKEQTKKNQLEKQVTAAKQFVANQKEVGAAVDKIPAADPTLTNQFKQQYSALQEKIGDNNTRSSFSILGKEELDANNQFAEDVMQYKDKTTTSLAAMQTNVNEWNNLSPRDRANTAFMGNTPLERKISEITCYASDPNNYDYRDRVSKNLYQEDDNPANPGVEIITKINPTKDLKGFDQATIEEGIKNGSILYDDATKQYSIKFKQKLGTNTWDGTFYHKIAEAPDSDKIWGKTQANIVNDKGELNAGFIINPGNPAITVEKVKGLTDKQNRIETTYLNMPAISQNAKMYYDAGAEALLGSDLKDMTQLQSFLQNKLNRGNESLEDWIKMYPTPEEQKDFVSSKLFEIDMETKLGKQYSHRAATQADVDAKRAIKIGDPVYYSQKADLIAIPKEEKSSNGNDENKPTAAEKGQTAFNDRIANVIRSGKGGVSKDGYTFMKMNGKWGIYDKDGIQKPGTENISNPRELATFIGSTIPLLK